MCGIIGYVGSENAVPMIVEGLKRLEYRGYDSAGIAVYGEKGFEVVKQKGRLAALEERLGDCTIQGSLGIGHTRWATHGEPSDVNSHPHLSSGSAWSKRASSAPHKQTARSSPNWPKPSTTAICWTPSSGWQTPWRAPMPWELCVWMSRICSLR